MKCYLLILLIVICSFNSSFTLQEPRSTASDTKMKVINYNPNTVHKYVGYYDYASLIKFEDDETIIQIFMGNPTGWQLVPEGSHLMIKPIGSNCKTNGFIITSKRMYWMEFDAAEASSVPEEDIVYQLKFLYNDSIANSSESGGPVGNTRVFSETTIPDFRYAKNLNFNYKISGSEKVAPLVVFDDGQFTYLKFRVTNADLPAVFLVNNKAEESLINFKIVDDYMVVELIGSVFSLRYGDEVACLFNETLPINTKGIIKRKEGILK